MRRLEQHAIQPGFLGEINRYAERLALAPPPGIRTAIINNYITESRLVEQAQLSISRNMRLGTEIFNTLAPPDTRITDEQLELAISAQRLQLFEGLRNQTLITNLYIYREVSDDELRQYLGWMLSNHGRWLVDVTFSTVRDVFDDLGRKLTDRLKKLRATARERPS
jgi:hypothetical protein